MYVFFSFFTKLIACLGNKESNFYQLLLYQGKQQPVALANITPGKLGRLKGLQHVIGDPGHTRHTSWKKHERNCIVEDHLFKLYHGFCVLEVWPESIDWFIEGQAFLRSYNSVPCPPTSPSLVSKLDRRHTGRLRKETTCSRERGEGGGSCAASYIARKSGPL